MSAVLRLQVRPMSIGDLDAVLAIEASAYGFPWTRGNFIDSLAGAHWAELSLDDDAQLIAYYVAMPVLDELHLLNLTVAPPLHGRGHARALLDRLDERCLDSGLRSVLLEVRRGNHRAQRLYDGRGFAAIGVRPGYYPAPHGRREDAIVMRRSVDPHGVD